MNLDLDMEKAIRVISKGQKAKESS